AVVRAVEEGAVEDGAGLCAAVGPDVVGTACRGRLGSEALCAAAVLGKEACHATSVATERKRSRAEVIVVSYCNCLGLLGCDKVVVDPIGERVVARRRFYGFSAK